jgi:hypothetical protein
MAKSIKVNEIVKDKVNLPVQPSALNDEPTEVVDTKTPEILETETVVEKAPLHIEPVMAAEYKQRIDSGVDATNEEKLVKFVENSTDKLVKLNDFLKSLYPAAAHNEPPLWKQQIVSRQIKLMLMKMENNGLIKIVNNVHSELGNPYFKGEEQRAAHYDIDTLQLWVEK